MTTIIQNSMNLEKSQSIRPQIVTQTFIDKSLSLRPPTLGTIISSSQDASFIPLNNMQSELGSQFLQNKQHEANIIALLQNNKSPAPVINEKIQRCSDFKQGKYGPIQICFKENTPKEELVLEHVIQYKRQFQLVYESEGRELFLYPKNECDVYKVNLHIYVYNYLILYLVHMYNDTSYQTRISRDI